MLNWDDPLANVTTRPHNAPHSMPASDAAFGDNAGEQDFPLRDGAEDSDLLHAEARTDTGPAPRPGDGIVGNEALMRSAGAAPVVDPNPLPPQRSL
ncbi:MAG: ribonucleotide-diphosphate reductase subunit beta, partial [Thiohalocapsa sp.]